MIRYINTFIRFLPLLIIPVLVLPLITSVIGLTSKPKYIATAALYMGQPLYIDSVIASDGPEYMSPAQRQADFLRELVGSRAFVGSVIAKTSLKDAMNTDVGRREVVDLVNSLTISSEGWFFVKLSLSNTTPGVSKEIITSTIAVFFDLLDNRIKTQVNSAFAFYQKRLKETEKTYQDADVAYKKFLTEHPGIGSTTNGDGTTRGLSQDDIEFGRLGSVRDVAKTAYDQSQIQMSSIQQAYEGYQQSRESNYRVQDEPFEEAFTAAKSKTLITMLAAGLGGGLLLLVLGTLVLTWIDTSAREAVTLRRVLADANLFVQEVPLIKFKKGGKQKDGEYAFNLRQKLAESLQPNEQKGTDKLLTGVN